VTFGGATWRSSAAGHLAVASLLGLTAGLALTEAPLEFFVAVALVGALALLVVLFLPQLADRDADFLRLAFVGALILRVGLALFIHYGVSNRALFASDHAVYERIGLFQAKNWENGLGTLVRGSYAPRMFYDWWNILVFYAIGPYPLVPKVFNAFLGACGVFPMYRLATNLFEDRRTSRIATTVYAVVPSLVLWSSMNLRDPIAIISILLLVDGAVQLRRRFSLPQAVLLAGYVAALGSVRPYLVLVVGLGIGLSFVTLRSKNIVRDFAASSLAALVLLFVIQYLGFGKEFMTDASLERMNTMREGLRYGGSALEKADISTPTGALLHLPQGLVYLLFAPFPWSVRSLQQAFSLPEVLLFYAMFPFVLLGARDALRARPTAPLPALGVLMTVLVAYALVEGNLGTAYRHKAQALGLVVVFGAGGFVGWQRRRAARLAALAAELELRQGAGPARGPPAATSLPPAIGRPVES
jgi:hypothetical protein